MPVAAGAFSVTSGSTTDPIKASDSPLFQPMCLAPPAHSSRRRSRLMLRRRNNRASAAPSSPSSPSDSKYKLQASTVAPDDRSTNPWYNFLNFRDSVADYADSLFSLEGGDATPATRPYMPNLEVEEQLTATAAAATATDSSSTVVAATTTELDKEELLMELASLSDTFDDLQSRYEATIDNLKDENSFLEEGIKTLTMTIEDQAQQIEQLMNQNTLGGVEVKEENDVDGIGAITEAEELIEFQNKIIILEADNELLRQRVRGLEVELSVKEENDVDGIGAITENKAEAEELTEFQNKITTLEADNELLRQRVRGLEVELSDVAFESRKIIAAAVDSPSVVAAAIEAPAAVVAMDVAAPIAEANDASTEEVEEVAVEQVKVATFSPHAPPTPIPQHLLQKQEMEMLRSQVKEYEVERNSVRKLFARGISRGVKKVGKALDLWRPIYLILCDGVRGDGKMAL
eukprot:CAMPEP_0201711080 /NCGR_PEP_ID=MMETSP0578-20130828/58958_1 /ASSEMBLY_ACC=CAM_ASM_000663 /TAXON_ID=267565 /ORGANISM="Skeletonema grethea, Strain CCMP 1804" /LENGTH=460 /DNA_ID=CAMNT_0048200129 /DNA_START=51 /DNA_END=1434 /DNA_ORIENTATION=+